MAVTFKYKARNVCGQETSGRVTASNKSAAINLLRQDKLFVTDIVQVSSSEQQLSLFFAPRVRVKELSLFCRQFATLISAGIPIISSLHTLYQQTENQSLRIALQDIAQHLEAGKSLSQSLAQHPRIFPPICLNLIEAGELSGSLEQVLDQLANYFEKYHELMEKLRSAITYPLFIILIAIVTIGTVFIFMLPTFTKVILDLQAPIPVSTAVVIKISDFLREDWYKVLIMFILLTYVCKKWLSTAYGKKLYDQKIFCIPVYGKLIRRMYVVRFSRTLALLLYSGTPLLTSLSVLKKQLQNSVIRQTIELSIRSLQEGGGLAVPLQKSKVFPPMVSQMIGIGEETGELEKLLNKIADFHEKEVNQLVNRLSALLEPILICLIGGILGIIMLSILLPIFDIMDSIG